MIEKLEQRIFLLIMVSLSIIILGTIILFTVLNYNNTINTTNFIMDRFMGEEPKKSPEGRVDDYKIKQETTIDGIYSFLIEDSIIVQSSNTSNDKTINDYALKVAKKNTEKGMIGKYIYKVRKINPNTIKITFVENEEAISHIKTILIFSVIISVISLVAIYELAKKVSKMIVKPVEETFEKQKQFISDASHELKTPLAVIEANADVLENEIGKNKWINYIQNEAESMNKLINELLLLAKIENIDNIKENKQFDLSKEIEIILSMFESMAYEKQISIQNNIEKNIIINANKEDIEHIVSTLTDNAIKHTEPEKEVRVELKKEKNEIVLEVKNIGKPIPEEEREKIFERFYRIDKSRNRKEKRYGLGLAIAKATVQKYNGTIEVQYKEPYTIFKVTIP
ncbi:MAG: HAMP domain-containing histidine kinase [Clostridia bacterium]|nr:HAMP domain-containing histidine kinase [Clostridia bacterium]